MSTATFTSRLVLGILVVAFLIVAVTMVQGIGEAAGSGLREALVR
jgi:hypothetical protein